MKLLTFKVQINFVLFSFSIFLISFVNSLPVQNHGLQSHNTNAGSTNSVSNGYKSLSEMINSSGSTFSRPHSSNTIVTRKGLSRLEARLRSNMNMKQTTTPSPQGLIDLQTLPITHKRLQEVEKVTNKLKDLTLND